ncbi:MAG: translation elongation factor Ts [Nitrospirota bacterium]
MAGLEEIKILREKTGAGMVNCKNALEKSGGNVDQAIEFLRQKGLSQADKKSDRVTQEGLVSAYIHAGGKIGVLIEVNCETDFVARNEEFQALIKDLGIHIAGSLPAPQYVKKEDIPAELVDSEVPLLEMPFIKNPEIKIKDLIAEKIAKTGENIQVRRFTRYQLGA